MEWAAQAARSANRAQYYKEPFFRYEKLLRKWENLTVNSPIWPHTIIFILFVAVDIAISFPLFRDIVRESGLFPLDPENPEKNSDFIMAVAILLAVLINAWAAVTAHFIAKGWYKEHQDLERWNLIYIKLGNELDTSETEAYMAKEIQRAKWLAILSGVVLLSVVVLTVVHRSAILEGTDTPTTSLYIQIFLPLAIIIGEIITGDYVWFLIMRWRNRMVRNRYRRRFWHFKNNTHECDRRAYEIYELENNNHETHPELPKDLKMSILRMRYRTPSEDKYPDPFIYRHATFVVKHPNTDHPLVGAKVSGVLNNGAKTDEYHTNKCGEVTIFWPDDYDRLELVSVDDQNIPGPFAPNGIQYITYPNRPY